jgi:alpha-amylase
MKRLLQLLVVLVILAGCTPVPTGPAPVVSATSPVQVSPVLTFTPTALSPTATTAPTLAAPTKPAVTKPVSWWSSAVFYEIFVRSFFDSNGDGIGDFNGMTQKLDYLNDGDSKTSSDLQISGIWLMPIQPSPSYHGYDVTDYYGVNPAYGTMDEFKRFLNEAHKRGIKVIIDLVLNHTSSQHPWFVEANNDPKSPKRDWYIWSDTNPGYSGPFGTAWHQGKYGYYYGMFSSGMPDLNYKNPEVTAEMEKIVQFWLKDVKVDGFRIDAAKHLIEEGTKQENTVSTHEWFKGFYQAYKAMNPDAFTIGEVAGSSPRLAATYSGDQMDMIFNFEIASGFVNSAKGQANSGVNSAIKFVLKDMPSWQFGTFLTNHDQNRVMNVVESNVEKAKVAASLMLTSPGVPFIYYGEEIGMAGQKPDEDIRLPMQWDGKTNAGFSTGTPWRAVGKNYLQANTVVESADPASLLNHYRKLLALRSQHPALSEGSLALLSTNIPGVYAALRISSSEVILVVVNLTNQPLTDYALSLEDPALVDGSYALVNLLGSGQAAPLTVTGGMFDNFKPLPELAPSSTNVFQLK